MSNIVLRSSGVETKDNLYTHSSFTPITKTSFKDKNVTEDRPPKRTITTMLSLEVEVGTYIIVNSQKIFKKKNQSLIN